VKRGTTRATSLCCLCPWDLFRLQVAGEAAEPAALLLRPLQDEGRPASPQSHPARERWNRVIRSPRSDHHGMTIVTNSGTGGVACEFDGDVKVSMIVIAAIDAMESKLRLRVMPPDQGPMRRGIAWAIRARNERRAANAYPSSERSDGRNNIL
jgi:hypothetical protein